MGFGTIALIAMAVAVIWLRLKVAQSYAKFFDEKMTPEQRRALIDARRVAYY